MTQLFVNGVRAMNCRQPNQWQFARLMGYEVFEDPEDTNYYLRYFYVQKDCIEFLLRMTEQELSATEFVVQHTWYVDVQKIVRVDSQNNVIITRILKTDEVPSTQFGCITAQHFYFFQNAIMAMTQPGEFYKSPDGLLYYYPREGDDMSTAECYIPVTTQLLEFNNIKGLTISNLTFQFLEGTAIGGITFTNFLIKDCIFMHMTRAFYFQGATDALIEHCLIEDMSGTGCGFGGCTRTTVNNCIIRHVALYAPYGFAIDFWAENHDTIITNNDISDATSSLIFFGASNEYDVETVWNVLIQNNHLHHGGYRMVDDLASVFYGRFPKGAVLDHNKVHDFYAANYCGNGLYADTGSSGAITSNNLVYNVSHSAFNLNYGIQHTVENNIFALCRTGISFGSSKDGEQVIDSKHNIVYLTREEGDSYAVEGPFFNDQYSFSFDQNLYWQSNNINVSFAGVSFDEWKTNGFDSNSIIADPLFADPENGDFSFTSTENIQKIDFKPFNMTFGVLGEEWRKFAENYTYHDPIEKTDEIPLIGKETFDRTTEAYYYKRITFYPNAERIEISTDRASEGSHSLKLEHLNEGTEFGFTLPLLFRNGNGKISFKLYLTDESKYYFDGGFGSWIFIEEGNLIYPYGTVIGKIPSNQWVNIEFDVFVGDAKTNNTFSLKVDDTKYTLEIFDQTFSKIDYFRIISRGRGTSYFDDIQTTIDTVIPQYFKEYVEEKEEEETITSTPSTSEENNDNDNKLNGGEIAAICIVVIIVIVGLCGGAFYLFKKRMKTDSHDDITPVLV